jgi:hypothetical protein
LRQPIEARLKPLEPFRQALAQLAVVVLIAPATPLLGVLRTGGAVGCLLRSVGASGFCLLAKRSLWRSWRSHEGVALLERSSAVFTRPLKLVLARLVLVVAPRLAIPVSLALAELGRGAALLRPRGVTTQKRRRQRLFPRRQSHGDGMLAAVADDGQLDRLARLAGLDDRN